MTDPQISAIDPDTGDTLKYSMDCGEYSSYFDLDPSAATLSFVKDYDLDNTTLDLPQELICDLLVKDESESNNGKFAILNHLYCMYFVMSFLKAI